MVVAWQLMKLKLASTVQVVAGRPDPLVLALVSWALSMANEKPLVTSANVSVPPVKLPFASRLPVKLSTNSSEPCFDFDALTVVAVKLVAELVNQNASANVPWKLNRVTWPGAALAGPAKASTVSAVTASPISARLISSVLSPPVGQWPSPGLQDRSGTRQRRMREGTGPRAHWVGREQAGMA